MAASSYTACILVLRKTKLGECDLIITGLRDDGSQMRAVAKGARKPSSPFSSRLELFSEADVLCAPGRSLDIIQDARLIAARPALRSNVERCAAAAPSAELLARVSQPDLESPRLFQASSVAFTSLDSAALHAVPAIAAAHLMKILAFAGLRPSFTACAICGGDVHATARGERAFSAAEGGVICDACRKEAAWLPVGENVLAWAQYLLSSTFRDIERNHPDPAHAFAVLRLGQSLVHEHVGARLKSLDLLFTTGFDFSVSEGDTVG